MTSLDGKTAIVTGATGYLGTAMCFSLARAGAAIVAVGRSSEKLDDLKRAMETEGFLVKAVALDVTDHAAVAMHLGDIDELSIIVNNAYSGGAGTVETSRPEAFEYAFSINVTAAQVLLQTCLPALRKSVQSHGYASVINIGSMYGMVSPNIGIYPNAGSANPPYYGASKAALIQWTKYAACEFGRDGIRVNAISPGPFPNIAPGPETQPFLDELIGRVPLGRLGVPRDIEGPLLFLASEQSSYVTGSNIVVDGGWTVW